MTRHLPPLNWFRVFEAAARHQKFTVAADELGMTQSAVSQQINAVISAPTSWSAADRCRAKITTKS